MRRAKKDFWQNKVEKIQSLIDAYKIVKWHNSGPKYQTPTPRETSETIEHYSPDSKFMLFRKTLLSRHLEEEDIDDSIPTVASRKIN